MYRWRIFVYIGSDLPRGGSYGIYGNVVWLRSLKFKGGNHAACTINDEEFKNTKITMLNNRKWSVSSSVDRIEHFCSVRFTSEVGLLMLKIYSLSIPHSITLFKFQFIVFRFLFYI